MPIRTAQDQPSRPAALRRPPTPGPMRNSCRQGGALRADQAVATAAAFNEETRREEEAKALAADKEIGKLTSGRRQKASTKRPRGRKALALTVDELMQRR